MPIKCSITELAIDIKQAWESKAILPYSFLIALDNTRWMNGWVNEWMMSEWMNDEWIPISGLPVGEHQIDDG